MADIIGMYFYFEYFPYILIRTLIFLKPGVTLIAKFKGCSHFSSIAQSCPTLSDPMDCSLPGSSVNGISQARVLEWGAIAFAVFGYC